MGRGNSGRDSASRALALPGVTRAIELYSSVVVVWLGAVRGLARPSERHERRLKPESSGDREGLNRC